MLGVMSDHSPLVCPALLSVVIWMHMAMWVLMYSSGGWSQLDLIDIDNAHADLNTAF